MNNKTNLQVPISVSLKTKAEEVAQSQGFSSLQELVRVFITNYTNGNVSITFGNAINPKVLEIYDQDLRDTRKAIKDETVQVHTTVADAISHLASL